MITDLSFEMFIQDLSKGLKAQDDQQRYCFILGAGASCSSQIPSGIKMVEHWENELTRRNEIAHLEWKKELGINKKNQAEHYSDYYDKCMQYNPDGLKQYLVECIEKGKASIGYRALAYILTKGRSQIVITTNFDHLTEDEVSLHEHTFARVVGHESLARYVNLYERRPTIIKLHRDILFDPKNSTRQTSVLENKIKSILPDIFKHYHPVFIGYAGNDKSLMDFLTDEKNVKKFRDGVWKRPYWTIYDKEPNHRQKDFLEKTEGILVKSCSFDEIMVSLGLFVGWRLPTKEEYLKAARNDAAQDYDRLDKQMKAIICKCPDIVDPPINPEEGEKDKALSKEDKKLLDDALDAYRQNNYTQALSILKKLVTHYPQNASLHSWISKTYFSRNQNHYDIHEAINHAKSAVETEPNNPQYHEWLAKVYYKNGNTTEHNSEIRIANELRKR